MKVRKYGSGGGGSIGQVKAATDMNRNGEARGRGMGITAGSKIWSGIRMLE